MSAVLHGRFAEAFRWNPLLFLLGIPAVIVFLHEYLRYIAPRLHLKPVVIPQPAIIGCIVLIIAYWVLRNIPVCSFLAPGG